MLFPFDGQRVDSSSAVLLCFVLAGQTRGGRGRAARPHKSGAVFGFDTAQNPFDVGSIKVQRPGSWALPDTRHISAFLKRSVP